jgi:Uma2 family endonuclease
MSVAPLPDWAIPPYEGFVAEDLDRLPELPSHTELIDGSLIFVSPQASFHIRIISLLEYALRASLPARLKVRREMTVTLGLRQRPESDLMIILGESDRDLDQTSFLPEDLVLAVEVISPESRVRDQKRKPTLYAEAGIAHFWLIENVDGSASRQVHRIDPDPDEVRFTARGAYSLRGFECGGKCPAVCDGDPDERAV